MRHRHTAMLTALMTAAVTSLAAAQQSAPDSTHQQRAIAHDEHAITNDRTRLHQDIALRDSARAALDRDPQRTQAEGMQIDSLKAKLDRDRKASPRDTALVNRELATLTRDRKQLDQDLDRGKQAAAHESKIEQRVKKESDAAIDAHHDLGQDHSKSSAAKPPASKSLPKSSASKSTKR